MSTCLALGAAALLAACDGDVDRDAYVKKNLALLRELPAIPGARLRHTESSGYKLSEQEDADIEGYTTTSTYSLPRGTRPAAAVGFYRRMLRDEWRVEDGSKAPSQNFRKGDAYLHILAGGGVVDVEVDHDCSPGCVGP